MLGMVGLVSIRGYMGGYAYGNNIKNGTDRKQNIVPIINKYSQFNKFYMGVVTMLIPTSSESKETSFNLDESKYPWSEKTVYQAVKTAFKKLIERNINLAIFINTREQYRNVVFKAAKETGMKIIWKVWPLNLTKNLPDPDTSTYAQFKAAVLANWKATFATSPYTKKVLVGYFLGDEPQGKTGMPEGILKNIYGYKNFDYSLIDQDSPNFDPEVTKKGKPFSKTLSWLSKALSQIDPGSILIVDCNRLITMQDIAKNMTTPVMGFHLNRGPAYTEGDLWIYDGAWKKNKGYRIPYIGSYEEDGRQVLYRASFAQGMDVNNKIAGMYGKYPFLPMTIWGYSSGKLRYYTKAETRGLFYTALAENAKMAYAWDLRTLVNFNTWKPLKKNKAALMFENESPFDEYVKLAGEMKVLGPIILRIEKQDKNIAKISKNTISYSDTLSTWARENGFVSIPQPNIVETFKDIQGQVYLIFVNGAMRRDSTQTVTVTIDKAGLPDLKGTYEIIDLLKEGRKLPAEIPSVDRNGSIVFKETLEPGGGRVVAIRRVNKQGGKGK